MLLNAQERGAQRGALEEDDWAASGDWPDALGAQVGDWRMESLDSLAGPAADVRGSAEPADGGPTLSWLQRRKETRQLDLKRKKGHRKQTRALLQTLWKLEAEARGDGSVVRASNIQLHAVLKKVTARVRSMTRRQPQPFPGAGPGCDARLLWPGPGWWYPGPQGAAGEARAHPQHGSSLPCADASAGLMGAHSLGVLYVCVEDWVVQRSNRAMELLCPFELICGYVGLQLPGVVHPDDYLQLAMLQQEQVHSFKPGDTLVLSVRMLRACQDQGTLVMAWRRQILEVAHVGRDEQLGGKLHVLFTSVLEPESLEPLTFDDSDRALFQEAAEAVSGGMTVDAQRTTTSMESLTKMLSDAGFKDRKHDAPTVLGFVAGVSGRVGRSLGIPQLLSFLQQGAKSTMTSVVRTHVLVGLAPEGTPWLQKSAALCAFGFMSRYHTFVSTSLSGRLTGAPVPGKDSRQTFYGVLKPQQEEGGLVTVIGSLGMIFKCTWDRTLQVHKRSLAVITHNTWSHGAAIPCAQESTTIAILGAKGTGALPRRVDLKLARTAPPDPVLTQKFLEFDKEGAVVEAPFAGLATDESCSPASGR